MHQTLVVGLTGQSGAGKSALRKMFSDRGVPVLDADEISRNTIEQSKECRMDLVLEFSTEIIRPDASLNRAKLAEVCFGDPVKLRRLNQIVYPYIVAEIMHKLQEITLRRELMAVLDAPTLYESGLDKRCGCVVAVLADQEIRLQRIQVRDGLTEEAAMRRINAQQKDDFYLSRTGEILWNNAGTDELRLAFMELLARLESLARGEKSPVLELPAKNTAKQDFEELTGSEPE